MTKRQKLRQRIARNPKNVAFQDLRTLLEAYGFQLKRSRGSHFSFVVNIGGQSVLLTIPYHRPLQAVYVKQALALIEQLDAVVQDEDEGDNDE